MTYTHKKEILLLELDDYSWLRNMYATFLESLNSKATVTRCTDAMEALEVITAGVISAVLVYEPSVMRTNNQKLVDALTKYTKNGGTTVFAAHCSDFVGPPEIDAYFKRPFNLNWKSGSYLRTTFSANPGVRLKLTEGVAASYSMKALNLKGVAREDLIYVTTGQSKLESLVFFPEKVELVDEGPVVYAQYYHGRLGWVGDVNNERETGPLVLAMLGL